MGNCKVPEALANCCKFYHYVSFLLETDLLLVDVFKSRKGRDYIRMNDTTDII